MLFSSRNFNCCLVGANGLGAARVTAEFSRCAPRLHRPASDRAIFVGQPGLLGKKAAAKGAAILSAVGTELALAHAQPVQLFVNTFEARSHELGHGTREGDRHAKHGRRRNTGVGWRDPIRGRIAIAVRKGHFIGVLESHSFRFAITFNACYPMCLYLVAVTFIRSAFSLARFIHASLLLLFVVDVINKFNRQNQQEPARLGAKDQLLGLLVRLHFHVGGIRVTN